MEPKTVRHDVRTAREFLDHVAYEQDPARLMALTARDFETIYEVPIVFRKEGLDELIVRNSRLSTISGWVPRFLH